MKKSFFAIAVFAAIAASCTTEETLNPTPAAAGDLFTCTLDSDVRTALDSTLTPLWEEGDYIILYNGAKATSETLTGQTTIKVMETDATMPFRVGNPVEAVTNNIIEKVLITSDMISADGRTVKFNKTIDDAADSYYAVVESKGAALIYSINTSGVVTLREAKSHEDAARKVVHAAVAKCTKDSRHLTFKNAYCQVKFTVPEGKYSKVTFEANSGSANTFVCGMNSIKCDGTSWGTAQSKTDPYTVTLHKTDSKAPYYVPVASTAVLDKGITIKCYTSNDDPSPLTVSTSKTFPIARGRVINLGNLEETAPVTSYYDAYMAGKDIVIGGVTYNKSTYGDGVLYTSDTNLTGDCKGLNFVAEGVTLKVADGTAKPTGDFIVLCDKPNAKAKFAMSGEQMRAPKAGIKYIFSNVEFDFSVKNSLVFASVEIGKIGFYNCKVTFTANYCTLTSSALVKNIEFDGCDLVTTKAFALISGDKEVKTDNVIIRNCQIYCTTGSKVDFKFCSKKVTETVNSTMGNVIIENNTFYDITWTQASYHGMVNPNSVDNFVLKKNIFAYSTTNNQYLRFLYLSSDSSNDPGTCEGYPETGEVSDNLSWNASARVFGCFQAATRLSWYSASYKEFKALSASPFTSVDVTSGTFVKSSDYASFGATR